MKTRCPPKKYEAVKILLDVSRVVVSSLDADKTSDLVLKESTKALGAAHAALFLIDDKSGRLMLHGALGFSEDELDNIKLLGSWEVVNDEVIQKKRSLIVNNIHNNILFRKKSLPFSYEKLPIKSFLAVPLEKDKKIIGILMVSNSSQTGRSFGEEDRKLLMGLSNHIAIALINAKLYKRLNDLFINTVTALTKTIDAKDPYTGGHSERVMKYALAIGREMKLKEDDMENVRLSSLLHDIGKVGVKDDILLKASNLSLAEKKEICKHPSMGVKIVEAIAVSHNIIRGIMEHHERYGGGGYPNDLKGESISLEARVTAVADAFDALTTDRPYHSRYSVRKAYSAIVKGAPMRFDPKVVKAFINSLRKHPAVWNAGDESLNVDKK